ncbi:MAG TPA: AraC family transcriptional regulator [Thermoanaerobaculia bacterium]|nr:AraC family transcriptional regulator [Thermoanaerobaculia bacterium]
MSATPEPDFDHPAWIHPGLDIDLLFKSPSFGITAWNCRCGRSGLSAEKVQLVHLISFVHGGAFVLHSEGCSEVIDCTTAVLFNPGIPYRSTHPAGCSDYGSSLVVRRDVLSDVMSNFDPAAEERPEALFPSVFGRNLSQSFLRHRLIVRGLMRGAPEDPDALDAALLEILGDVARSCSPPGAAKRAATFESTRARRRYVHDAQLILQERFREQFRLEEIARKLYVSPFHLCRLFKQETGMSIQRYANRLRLREAMEPLTEGADLTQLALSLGFAGHSHFTNAFRKEFGIPPSEARRRASASRIAEMKKALS